MYYAWSEYIVNWIHITLKPPCDIILCKIAWKEWEMRWPDFDVIMSLVEIAIQGSVCNLAVDWGMNFIPVWIPPNQNTWSTQLNRLDGDCNLVKLLRICHKPIWDHFLVCGRPKWSWSCFNSNVCGYYYCNWHIHVAQFTVFDECVFKDYINWHTPIALMKDTILRNCCKCTCSDSKA